MNKQCRCKTQGGESKGLTAIVVCGGELGALVSTAGTVARLHLQLVPRGLAQLAEEQRACGVCPHSLPRPRALGPEVQQQAGDGASPAGPAHEVEARMGGVDVGEQGLVLGEHGLWRERETGVVREHAIGWWLYSTTPPLYEDRPMEDEELGVTPQRPKLDPDTKTQTVS